MQKFVQDNSKRKYISFNWIVASCQRLNGHIHRRSDVHIIDETWSCLDCKPKISNFPYLSTPHDICWLQIPVKYLGVSEISISIEDLAHDIDDGMFRQFLFLLDETTQIAMRTVFHDHIDVGLCFIDVITANNMLMVQCSVYFHFSFEQLETCWTEILQLNDLDCILFQLFSLFYTFIDAAAISFSQHLVEQYFVFSYLDPFIAFLIVSLTRILCAAIVFKGRAVNRALERIFLFR